VLVLLGPSSTVGLVQDHDLTGLVFSIEDGEQKRRFFSNVIIEFVGIDKARTDDHGEFHIRIPAAVRPGQEVTLLLDKKGYAICSPLFGKQLIHAGTTTVVEVRMLPQGSKLFWTHERIEAFITGVANDSAKQIKRQQSGETDLSPFIQELARHYGFTSDEVRQELGKWMEAARKDVADFRKQGMVAFAEKNFRLAGENFGRSADLEKRQGAENFRKSAADRELSGDSYCSALDFGRALQAYQSALKALDVYHDGLGDLGLKVYPEYATDVRDLSFKLANVKVNLGERVAGPDSQRYLVEAIQEYQGQITQVPKSSNPHYWAATQINLGLALANLGRRQGGAEAARRLDEAVEAYRQALTFYTREVFPEAWAGTQNDLAVALVSLGERQAGAEGARRLDEAIEACRLALAVYTRDNLPRLWAALQDNLGYALKTLGERQVGAEGARRLDDALEAYRQALTVFTRDVFPQQWAGTQFNLGLALTRLGERQGSAEGARRLDEAVEAFRQALTVYTRDNLPQYWARTQDQLGNALAILGERQGGAEGARRLDDALEAYRLALSVRTRDNFPHDWAGTQIKLSSALGVLAELRGGAEGERRLEEALEACRQALTIFTRDIFPQNWAGTQINLGKVLQILAERQGDAERAPRLDEAVEAYRRALTVYTRDTFPIYWAATQDHLGDALQSLGEKQGGAEGARRLDEAVEAFRQALTVYTRDISPQQWAKIHTNLGVALAGLGERREGAEGARRRAEAVEAFRQVLAVRTPDVHNQDWADSLDNLGIALQIQIRLDGFPKGLEQVHRLSQADGIRNDPVAQASLQTLALVCHVAADQNAEASRAFANLVAPIERQPDDFHLVWNWAVLRELLAESKVPSLAARRESLRKLIDAVGGDNKAAILTGLKKVQDAFTAPADLPVKPPKK
jgi:tetratricopeptide (TPR) repeat protein